MPAYGFMGRGLPRSTLVPYTTLFRSGLRVRDSEAETRTRFAGIERFPENVRCRRSAYGDRKSTRLNSSHPSISYAVFCLKKKNQEMNLQTCNAPLSSRHYISQANVRT